MTESGDLRELGADLMELAINVGLIGSVIEQFPEHVQENFKERVKEIREWTGEQTRQIQEFGSAYDGE
jgi:hypothetical protein